MRFATKEEVNGLYGHSAILTQDYLEVSCPFWSNGFERWYFGSKSKLMREFAEKMLGVISVERNKCLRYPYDMARADSLAKAYKHFWRVAGHDESVYLFVPADKEDYELYEHVHGEPYPKNLIMGTAYLPN